MINIGLFSAYIKHQFQAKTRHGVHSPFVYNLVDKVIYNFAERTEYAVIEQQRQHLLADDRTITVTDLGAGSHVNNNKQKRVKQIARNALKPRKLAQLIFRLTNEFKPGTIIELGTCLGITTAYLAKASPAADVVTIEGCPQTAGIAGETLRKLQIANVQTLTGNFDVVFPSAIRNISRLDLVFVDGNHRKQATLEYFRLCLPKVLDGSLLIFDDIYWSRGMKEAWEEIKAHPQVTVTVDLFWIGLVFFRKEQVKENFRIKF